MKSDRVIQAYIERIMQIQDEKRNLLPNKQELRDLVEELGYSEQELDWIQKEFEKHLKNGQGFQSLENWREALKEYEQALLLNPYDAQTLALTAGACKKLWDQDAKKKYRQKAKSLARLCLKVKPGYTPALKIVDQISRYEYNQSKNQSLLLATVIFFIFLFYFLTQLFT
ncbi:MAG: hypothetical protein NW226_02905 [Microscillaceae bacterium]|nr:hypothetical protein [Microscillaceae bacterium]